VTRIDSDGRDAAMTAETPRLEADAGATRGTVNGGESVASSTTSAQMKPAPMLASERAEPASRTRAADRTELPGTASALPLIALIGLASLAGSAWMRRSRRSMSTR
jgi:hypothetical protein